jgi:predicted RNA-binding Zn-ribbon protein involved in translation (DUF1610 family)
MRRPKYTREVLAPVASESRSVAEVLRKLGLQTTGGNYRHINSRLRFFGVSTAHFSGQGWSRGESTATDERLAARGRRMRRPDHEVFVENSLECNGARLTRRLLRLGRAYSCSPCGIREWRGRPLSLHLDHVNGVNNDNRLENLRFLCPNCHSQTESYCKKGRGGAAR